MERIQELEKCVSELEQIARENEDKYDLVKMALMKRKCYSSNGFSTWLETPKEYENALIQYRQELKRYLKQ